MKVVAKNRRATFDYDVLETLEAGIILTGAEAKSCRLGQVHLAGSYVSLLGGRPILKHVKISPYPYAAEARGATTDRGRELLLSRKEIEKLTAAQEQRGIAVIPLEVRAGAFIKVLLAVGRGRKRVDKRQRIREREVERNLRQRRG